MKQLNVQVKRLWLKFQKPVCSSSRSNLSNTRKCVQIYLAMNVGNLKGGAKFELLFNKSASEQGGDKSEREQINP